VSELLNEIGEISRAVRAANELITEAHEKLKVLAAADLRNLHRRMVQAGMPYDDAHHLLLRLHQSRDALQRGLGTAEVEVDAMVELMQSITGEMEMAESVKRQLRV